jgi:dTDP-4-amino-4,6-dideoxygalactose transaminase
LTAQLEAAPQIQAARHRVWTRYHHELAAWAELHGVVQPRIPAGASHPAHIYWLRVGDLDLRTRLLAHLRSLGVHATFHYQPLHSSEMGRTLGGRPGDCPVAEAVADTLLRLPLYADLTDDDVSRVVAAVTGFRF